MKKTTKKLNIKKETVAAFTTMSENEMLGVNGGTNTGTATTLTKISESCPYQCGSVVE